MKLDNNDAVVRVDSIDVQTGSSSAGEIDLYDELTAFAELSPEEQVRLVDRPGKTAEQTDKPSAEKAEEEASQEPILTQPPIESAKAETPPARTEKSSTEELPSAEPVLTEAPIEPVEVATAAPAADSDSLSQDSNAHVERSEVSPPAFEGSRPSGPLSGFSLAPDFVFTGALSRGVCLTCGTESGADDLFCMTCGVFIDEIASSLPVDPTTCGECKRGISADEIFCPWCGSVLPAA